MANPLKNERINGIMKDLEAVGDQLRIAKEAKVIYKRKKQYSNKSRKSEEPRDPPKNYRNQQHKKLVKMLEEFPQIKHIFAESQISPNKYSPQVVIDIIGKAVTKEAEEVDKCMPTGESSHSGSGPTNTNKVESLPKMSKKNVQRIQKLLEKDGGSENTTQTQIQLESVSPLEEEEIKDSITYSNQNMGTISQNTSSDQMHYISKDITMFNTTSKTKKFKSHSRHPGTISPYNSSKDDMKKYAKYYSRKPISLSSTHSPKGLELFGYARRKNNPNLSKLNKTQIINPQNEKKSIKDLLEQIRQSHVNREAVLNIRTSDCGNMSHLEDWGDERDSPFRKTLLFESSSGKKDEGSRKINRKMKKFNNSLMNMYKNSKVNQNKIVGKNSARGNVSSTSIKSSLVGKKGNDNQYRYPMFTLNLLRNHPVQLPNIKSKVKNENEERGRIVKGLPAFTTEELVDLKSNHKKYISLLEHLSPLQLDLKLNFGIIKELNSEILKNVSQISKKNRNQKISKLNHLSLPESPVPRHSLTPRDNETEARKSSKSPENQLNSLAKTSINFMPELSIVKKPQSEEIDEDTGNYFIISDIYQKKIEEYVQKEVHYSADEYSKELQEVCKIFRAGLRKMGKEEIEMFLKNQERRLKEEVDNSTQSFHKILKETQKQCRELNQSLEQEKLKFQRAEEKLNKTISRLKGDLFQVQQMHEKKDAECNELNSPSRFIAIHYLMSFLDCKVPESEKDRERKIKTVDQMMAVMYNEALKRENSDYPKALPQEKLNKEEDFPPSVNIILYKLGRMFNLSPQDINMQREALFKEKIIEEPESPIIHYRSKGIQTMGIQDLCSEDIITLIEGKGTEDRNPIKKCLTKFSLFKPLAIPQSNILKIFESIMEKKVIADTYEISSEKSDFPNFFFDQFLEKYGLKTVAISGIISIYQGLKEIIEVKKSSYSKFLLSLLQLDKESIDTNTTDVIIKAIYLFNQSQEKWMERLQLQNINYSEKMTHNLDNGGFINIIDLLFNLRLYLEGQEPIADKIASKIFGESYYSLTNSDEINHYKLRLAIQKVSYHCAENDKSLKKFFHQIAKSDTINSMKRNQLIGGLLNQISGILTEKEVASLVDYLDSAASGVISLRIFEEKLRVKKDDMMDQQFLISKERFICIIIEEWKEYLQEQRKSIMKLFEQYDANRNGVLELSEFEDMLQNLDPTTNKSWAIKIFRQTLDATEEEKALDAMSPEVFSNFIIKHKIGGKGQEFFHYYFQRLKNKFGKQKHSSIFL